MTIKLYNTLTRKTDDFTPADPKNVRMYVCGPTVYDKPHIGNARSVVVYDVLFRLLKHQYPKVTYVRNITDVDDKINAAAKERGITIQQLTKEVTAQFHADMDALGCLRPTHEPRATEHIQGMIAMIEKLITNGNAYVAEGHVLFDVTSDKNYGCLSGRTTEDQQAGARIAVEGYKKNPGDFVLWKPADAEDDASSKFESPWGVGRPGWHIECSVMSTQYLGDSFDLHGGGADLMFPHHENEIAQSTCATGKPFAQYWVHNGFLTVNGEKMSKSLGNFITVRDLLDKGVNGEVIRLALFMTHYRKPLDWTEKLLADAKKTLDGFYRVIAENHPHNGELPEAFVMALENDLNVSEALSVMHSHKQFDLKEMGAMLGILQQSPETWFKGEGDSAIDEMVAARVAAKKAKNYPEADRIRKELEAQGIILEDRPDGTTDWRRRG